ncbi:TetR/AcrR family transcriptional regulator [Nisaea nitritireducens]|uniref:TetR/AcrR family transcriptional regulator n=1 Tax=Nisaea nitritireducens TaxID=568392 RepID=UPI0018667AF2|nr:TetR/AcrR family transcriptional regulator [Nisaea nitritireducens]
MKNKDTRALIVDCANDLFYRQGFEATSFADIAAAVGISRGNFYYHFKAKDDLLEAVIARRMANTSEMLQDWESAGEDPAERIRSFIQILIRNRDKIEQFGCPVGSLSTELAKLNHSAQDEAARIFTLFRVWLRRQFERLGRAADADALAMHLLVRSQGVATLSAAYRDAAFVDREVASMCAWLASETEPGASAPSSIHQH